MWLLGCSWWLLMLDGFLSHAKRSHSQVSMILWSLDVVQIVPLISMGLCVCFIISCWIWDFGSCLYITNGAGWATGCSLICWSLILWVGVLKKYSKSDMCLCKHCENVLEIPFHFAQLVLNNPYTKSLCKIKLRWKQFLQQTELKFDGAIKCEPILGSLMSCPFQHIIFKRK